MIDYDTDEIAWEIVNILLEADKEEFERGKQIIADRKLSPEVREYIDALVAEVEKRRKVVAI